MNPTARTSELHVEHLNGEVLVYDMTAHQSHCLSPEAAAIWQAADGSRDIEEIAAHCATSTAAVEIAIEKLDTLGLMEAGATRRDALRFLGTAAGVAAISVPVITSLAAPAAAHAASLGATGATCTDGSQCASGVCTSAGTCA